MLREFTKDKGRYRKGDMRDYPAPTWRALDACSNSVMCSQTVTIVDTTAPVLTCAADATVECGTTWQFALPGANDLCDGTNVTLTVVGTVTNAGACAGSYSATRTWRALDSCSNAALCSQTITVVDTTAPELVCAADRVVECGSAWAFDAPAASDDTAQPPTKWRNARRSCCRRRFSSCWLPKHKVSNRRRRANSNCNQRTRT